MLLARRSWAPSQSGALLEVPGVVFERPSRISPRLVPPGWGAALPSGGLGARGGGYGTLDPLPLAPLLALLLVPLLAPTLETPAPAPRKLVLPPPPEMPTRTIQSDPPAARIEDRPQLDFFQPWGLLHVAVGRRLGDEGRFTIGLQARLAAPIRLYGHARRGYGIAPTGSLSAHTGFRSHATGGLALGLLEDRRDFYTPPSGFVFIGEVAVPFSGQDGARLGFSGSLFTTFRGPALGLGYTRFPLAAGVSHALLLTLGVNLVGGLWR